MATFQPASLGLGAPVGPQSVTLDLPGSADVNAAVKTAGMSFGKLVETTGLAIAESQRQLNDVGAASTSALAAQQVEVIAAQVNAYDDNGNLIAEGTKTLPMKLPLINFIDPVFYEWAQVRLQGMFYATEFVSSTETSTAGVSASASASQSGVGFLFGAGSHRATFGVSSTSTDVDNTLEQSFGHIRASALLQPKTDIGVPKPRQLVNAPSLGVLISADVDDTTEPGARRKNILIVCFTRDGAPQATKKLPLSIDVQGAQWTYLNPPAGGDLGPETDAQGQIGIRLTRQFPTPAGQELPDTTPVDVTVTVRMGVVSSTTVVRF